MIQYTLLDPVTGYQWTVSDFRLTRNLRLNCILFRGDAHLGIITHRDLVFFTQWCAGKILALMERAPHQSVTHALAMVDRWLEDQQSVTPEELEDAWGDIEDVWVAELAASAVVSAVMTDTEAPHRAARAAENAQSSGISFETQAQWLVEHLQSGK